MENAGASGQNGEQAGQGGNGPSPDNSLPAELHDLAKKLDQLALGANVDLDGDGAADAVSILDEAGVFRIQLDADEDGNPELESEQWPDGSERRWEDDDGDGLHDLEQTYEVEPMRILTSLIDTDADGRVETRITERYDDEAGTAHVIEELIGLDGSITKVSERTKPSDDLQGAGGTKKCTGFEGFPMRTGGPALRLGALLIPYDGGGGRCSKAEADRLASALACSLSRGKKCLDEMRRALATGIIPRLASPHRKITVGCSAHCVDPNHGDVIGIYSRGRSRMNFNAGHLLVDTDEEICSVMLHELIHAGGHSHAEESGRNQTDEIYSCARYCGGCRAAAEPNLDCARCASKPKLKETCGLKEKRQTTPCPALDLCHGGIGINAHGVDCEASAYYYCDDSLAWLDTSFLCVKTCPPHAPRSPEASCQNTSLQDSCSSAPPECLK